VTAPTEEATALALEHTAVLAGRPGNRAPLREMGRYFGRLAHLLDAVEDLSGDQQTGAWNPLAATGTTLEEAERLCRDSVHGIRLALAEVELEDGALVHRLLAHETDAAVRRVFGHAHSGHAHPGHPAHARSGDQWTPPPMGPNPFDAPLTPPPPVRRNPLAACGMWALLCCTCQACCRDEYENPCTGRRMHGACRDCDCDCDCCDCCCCDQGVCESIQCCEALDCCDCSC
jgi:hypothetical protein